MNDRVIYAVEGAVFLANELYDHALSRFGGSLFDFGWGDQVTVCQAFLQ
jgi:hypothetical protein